MREDETIVFFELLKAVNSWGEFVECDSFLNDGRLCEFRNNKKSPYKIIIYPNHVVFEQKSGQKESKSFDEALSILVTTWYDDFDKTYWTILIKSANPILGHYEILDKNSFNVIGTLTHLVNDQTKIQVSLTGFIYDKEVPTCADLIKKSLIELSSKYYEYKNYVREN